MRAQEHTSNIDEKRKDIIENINLIKEIGINQKDISKATNLSEDDISKIKSEYAPLKKMEKINELYNHLELAIKCKTKKEYQNIFDSNKLTESKACNNIEKYLNIGKYIIKIQKAIIKQLIFT